MPPSYYYHLKFELYPTPDPAGDNSDAKRKAASRSQHPVWQPVAGASIFDNLPWHHSTAQPESEDEDERDGRDEKKEKKTQDTGKASGQAAAAARDWRFGRVRIASFDMEDSGSGHGKPAIAAAAAAAAATPAASLGPMLGGAGQATRARYSRIESGTKTTEAGWGIVHLYREGGSGSGSGSGTGADEDGSDGTILCIPAVPSYLAPRDFLGFVGERWRGDVSHYRMVLTSRTNRYMVLLKFREAARAREWRAAFDGRVFNSMEAEICHVAYIKSIGIETPGQWRTVGAEGAGGTGVGVSGSSGGSGSSGASANPKAPAVSSSSLSPSPSHVSNSPRPFPPPTPNLIELPTCPVCLERMDDTAGLMTILCQHVFHCTCLQTWKGSGCPVCRATNPLPTVGGGGGADTSAGESHGSTATGSYDPNNAHTQPFGAGISNLCAVCDCADDLWICLICGNVGCGRYKGGHAKDHWKETAHSFSLELETQYVWDYAGDMWVHRLIRAKGDGKVVELPGRSRRLRRGVGRGRGRGRGEGRVDDGNYNNENYDNDNDDDDDDEARDNSGEDEEEEEVVPRAKLDRIGLEYTHLLTSQLESQRVYFEEMVSKAADKAAQAAQAAERASAQTAEAVGELRELRAAHDALAQTAVPALERDLERERRRADKAAELARSLGRSLQEEKRVSEGLMTRIRHLQDQTTAAQAQALEAQAAQAELQEANRDLTMFISGQEKLRELEAEGRVEAGEIEEGTASVPEERKSKGKGKGRKR